MEANKEINKCLSFQETCNKRPYVRVQKLLGAYKANAVDEPEQYPGRGGGGRGGFNMTTTTTTTAKKDGDKIHQNRQ